MKRHIALLRGINISGKNKVPMAELKKCFEAAGFLEVKTWLNSGNVVFSCEEADAAALADRIERMMQCEFGLDIPVFVPIPLSARQSRDTLPGKLQAAG